MIGVIRRFGLALVCVLATGSLQARADDPAYLTFAAGWYDMNRQVDEATEFRVEYRGEKLLWIVKPLVGGMVTTDGGLYGYGGIMADLFFGRRLVLTPSFAAGYYEEGNGRDLGHEVEFRSGIELAYRFDDRTRLGVSFYHLSNAGLGDHNPGTEVLSLVYSIPLGPGTE